MLKFTDSCRETPQCQQAVLLPKPSSTADRKTRDTVVFLLHVQYSEQSHNRAVIIREFLPPPTLGGYRGYGWAW